MKLYAESRRYRARQLVSDAAVVVWVVLWIEVGLHVHDLVTALAAPGRAVENAGLSFARSVESTGGEIDDLPVVGDALRAPFDAIAGAGRTLESAGHDQQQLVLSLALWLGVLFAIIPIAFVLYRYLPERYRWTREASAAHHLRVDAQDLELFALRAAATRPLHELRRASPDPAGDLASRRFDRLAALELEAMGLKLSEPGRGTT